MKRAKYILINRHRILHNKIAVGGNQTALTVGFEVDFDVDFNEGLRVGPFVGAKLGRRFADGNAEGVRVGDSVGVLVEAALVEGVNVLVGLEDGEWVGFEVGMRVVGLRVGMRVDLEMGDKVGFFDGAVVPFFFAAAVNTDLKLV